MSHCAALLFALIQMRARDKFATFHRARGRRRFVGAPADRIPRFGADRRGRGVLLLADVGGVRLTAARRLLSFKVAVAQCPEDLTHT